VVVLDVSPSMHPYISYVRRAVLTYLHSKTLKSNHEVAFVLYGTRGTRNPVHDAAVAENPDFAGEYTNIVVLESMHKPTFATFKTIDAALTAVTESGGGGTPTDFEEAIIVAGDLINRSIFENEDRKKIPTKRIILLSNFLSRHPNAEDERDLDDISSILLESNTSVEVISLDIPSDEVDPRVIQVKKHNNDILDTLSTKINMKIRGIMYPADVAGVFPYKEHTVHTAYATTELSLGDKLKIAVKFCLKTKQERTPSLGKESPLVRGDGFGGGGYGGGDEEEEEEDGDGASGSLAAAEVEGGGESLPGIKKSTEYYREDDKDQLEPVPPEEMVRAFRVRKQNLKKKMHSFPSSLYIYFSRLNSILSDLLNLFFLSHILLLRSILFLLQYGREVVPMDKTEEDAATYKADNGLQILGFTTGTAIPRHYSMTSPYILVADKGHLISQAALTALVIATHQENKVAIMRFTFRNKIRILACQPVLATGAAVAHFLCNSMPFQEDLRDFQFASLQKEDRRPIDSQYAAALNLIDAMPLHRTAAAAAARNAAVFSSPTGGSQDTVEEDLKPSLLSSTTTIKEDLVPETTANPIINRFVNHFIEKALHPNDPSITPPSLENDPLLQRIISQHRPDTMPSAETAAEAFKSVCPTGQVAKAAHKLVTKLHPGQEKEDFISMMDQKNYQDAISNMRKHIENVVDTSVADQRYPDALSSLKVLREQCIQHKKAAAFNSQLQHLKDKYAKDSTRGGFWELICKNRVGQVTANEAAAAAAMEEDEDMAVEENGGAGGSGSGRATQQQQILPSKEEAALWMGCGNIASDEESA
jgi:Ku70/Ku80 beta-barrel domain/Ku C terminal domain like/Ku70/Ku80 N-terminal alpha/beta domain